MAEVILFNSVEKILLQLGSYALQQIGLAWDVKKELRKMRDTMSTLRNVLQDAEKKQVNNSAVKEWLLRLKVVVRDADDLLDEFATEALRREVETQGSMTREVRYFFTRSNPIKFRYAVGQKIKDIMEGLDQIVSDMGKFAFIVGVVDRPAEIRKRADTHSFVTSSNVIGREGDKEAIIQLLAPSTSEENVQIIPIVGMGGMGKTTLAQLVYNDNRITSQFKRLWVCVSDDFDVKKIISKIVGEATRTDCNSLGMEELQSRLRQVLGEEKYFLVLDDIWNEDPLEWRKLQDLLTVGAGGSQILVTTRSKKVASIVGTIDPYELKGLRDEECLSILVKSAFKKGEELKRQHQHLVNIGREIVKKCGGVPLAARSLGAMLFLNTNEHDWLSLRDNELWTLVQNENDILPVLKLSYNQMPSYLKQCFAYCSLFEKDEELDKWELIYHWMAQGFIQSSLDQNKELEDIGESYVDELVRMSFLQCYFSGYKMHDLVHDLAQLVAGNECFTIKQNTKAIPESVSHVSFDPSLYEEIPRPLLEVRKWRTILLPRKRRRSFDSSFEKLVSSFKCLRVLDTINYVSTNFLPRCKGKLKHLRFLRFRCCDDIEKLPKSFGKLLNLQFLDLQYSMIRELPKDFEKLINLRVLTLSSNMTCLPEKGIGGLTSLRTLRLWNHPELMSLGEGIRQLACLRQLKISWCPKLASLPSGMRYLTALKELTIRGCDALIFSEDDFQGLTKLKSLWLRSLPQLVSLPKGLQDASASLNDLRIWGCKNLTTLSESVPNLTSLQRFRYCPALSSLPEGMQRLTSLQRFEIDDCPALSSLPEGMKRLTALRHLKIIRCPILSQRCEEASGEDWPKIAHVQEIQIDGTNIVKKRRPEDLIGSVSHPPPQPLS